MRQIGLLLSIVLIIFSVPFALAHPDTVGFSINTLDGIVSDGHIIGILQDKKGNTETEFLSISWIFQNFILLLTGIITITIVIIMTIAYREEIFKKNKQHKIKKTIFK